MPKRRSHVLDVRIENHGSLYGLRALSAAAKDWVAENLPGDAPAFGGAVFVEPRYVGDILLGMRNDGLAVSK